MVFKLRLPDDGRFEILIDAHYADALAAVSEAGFGSVELMRERVGLTHDEALYMLWFLRSQRVISQAVGDDGRYPLIEPRGFY
jgi:hypothetical protein